MQHTLIKEFPLTAFRHSKLFVVDVTDKSEQLEKAAAEHSRVHRAVQENVKQILLDYFFSKNDQNCVGSRNKWRGVHKGKM